MLLVFPKTFQGFFENISITPEDAVAPEDVVALEKRTVLQGESKEWLNEHSRRITASNCGKVLFRVKVPSESMLKGIFLSSISLHARAIAHGKAKGKGARTIYCRKMQKIIPHFALYDAGFTVNPLWPYFGASPDGKVYDPSEPESPSGLLEIKCPYSLKNKTINQAAASNTCYVESRNSKCYLNRNHRCGYFAQVQGQLALTGLK